MQLVIRGSKRFKGAPDPDQLQELEAIHEVGDLETLAERVLDVSSWAELLESHQSARPRRRKKS